MKASIISFDAPENVFISAIVPVADRYDEAEIVWRAYYDMLASTGRPFELIYVIDGMHPTISEIMKRLEQTHPLLKVQCLNQQFGEAACIREGVKISRGEIILLLPPYLQILPEAIPVLIDRLATVDVATAVRNRQLDQPLNRLRGWGFEKLAKIAGSRFADPGCSVRAIKRKVFDEIVIQDEQHRFLPMLAERVGFVVEDIVLPQADSDRRLRTHQPIVYLSRFLDLLSISFLMRFLQKPFRFFGSVGAGFIAAGLMIGIYIVIERLFGNVPLADRPMLLLTVLLIVLGLQIAAIGLIAEIIIFTRSRGTATYHIQTIVEHLDENNRERA